MLYEGFVTPADVDVRCDALTCDLLSDSIGVHGRVFGVPADLIDGGEERVAEILGGNSERSVGTDGDTDPKVRSLMQLGDKVSKDVANSALELAATFHRDVRVCVSALAAHGGSMEAA